MEVVKSAIKRAIAAVRIKARNLAVVTRAPTVGTVGVRVRLEPGTVVPREAPVAKVVRRAPEHKPGPAIIIVTGAVGTPVVV